MDNTAYEPYSHRGSDYDPLMQPRAVHSSKNRSPGRKTGLRRACASFSTISAAISLGILGVSIDVVITLAKTSTARLLWDYNMMMKAWPLTGAPAVPTYVTIGAASATALLNIILLLSILFGVSRHANKCFLIISLTKSPARRYLFPWCCKCIWNGHPCATRCMVCCSTGSKWLLSTKFEIMGMRKRID